MIDLDSKKNVLTRLTRQKRQFFTFLVPSKNRVSKNVFNRKPGSETKFSHETSNSGNFFV